MFRDKKVIVYINIFPNFKSLHPQTWASSGSTRLGVGQERSKALKLGVLEASHEAGGVEVGRPPVRVVGLRRSGRSEG